MDEIEVAVSVLAAVTLPLVGVGPMLMRTLSGPVFGILVLPISVLVLMLTRAPWAAVLTLCVGVALLLVNRRPPRRGATVYVEEPDTSSR